MEQTDIQRVVGQKVLKTVESLSDTAVKNKQAAEEISLHTQELITQTEQLQNAIRQFKISESTKVFR